MDEITTDPLTPLNQLQRKFLSVGKLILSQTVR